MEQLTKISGKQSLLFVPGIYEHYHDLEKVQAIYIQELPEVYNVYVLLDQEHYDNELMDALLEREEHVLDLYPDQLFQFYYWPALEACPPQVPENSEMLFSR